MGSQCAPVEGGQQLVCAPHRFKHPHDAVVFAEVPHKILVSHLQTACSIALRKPVVGTGD